MRNAIAVVAFLMAVPLVAVGLLVAAGRHVHEDTQRGPRPRQMSVGVVLFPIEPLGPGTERPISRRASWSPPVDAYVVGWSFLARSPGSHVAIAAPDNTILAREEGGAQAVRPLFLPAGTGLLVPKAKALTVFYSIYELPAPETRVMIWWYPAK